MKLIKLSYASLILALLILIGFRHYNNYQNTLKPYLGYLSYYKSLTLYNSDYKKLSPIEKVNLKPIILKQVKALKTKGWSDDAIKYQYLRHLQITSHSHTLDKTLIARQFSDTNKIGSPQFQTLWKIQIANSQQEKAKENLHFILNFLDFPDELPNNLTLYQKMLAKFDDNLRPTDNFWKDISHLVKLSFPEQELANETSLARQTHQVRYLFSLQQANWVRKHYKTKNDTDASAMAKYLITLQNESYTLLEPARYHNKVAKFYDTNDNLIPTYPNHRPITNFKILIQFHSEFILSSDGNFLVAIDDTKYRQSAIVNSASFNYADENDLNHEHLDIEPIDVNDPEFIKKTLDNHNHPFETASLSQQKSKSNKLFSRDGKSLKTLTQDVREQFTLLMQNTKNSK